MSKNLKMPKIFNQLKSQVFLIFLRIFLSQNQFINTFEINLSYFRGKPRIQIYYNKIKKPQKQSMIKNPSKAESQQRKSQIISDDESCQIRVQHVNKQMTTHTDFDIKYDDDDKKIVMYIQLDPKNIVNLTKQANKNKTFQDERKYYKNCVFIRKIQTPQSHLKGNFRITYLHYKGITFTVQLKRNNQNNQDQMNQQELQCFARMKVHYKTQQNWETKWVNCDESHQNSMKNYNFQISASDVEKILKQKLLLEIFFEKVQKVSKDYCGIQNQGNTCYANSTLQVLYHFIPLRKMIVQLSSKKLKKLTKSLQQIFVDLMTAENSVRAETLLQCFEKIDNVPHRQQDIHQFLISFFDQLETELPQVAGFWTGKDYQVTYSKQVKYETKQQQNFTELQLLMSDTKGTYFHSITDSLQQLLQQDRADEPIDTDQHGKLQVYKSRFFQNMPPLLFMNIKRYQYNAKRRQLNKINLDLTYPKSINLDFLIKTHQGLDYILYAVVVHKGRTPNSGHYFCFVNVSKDVNNPSWYQFNDSIVRKVKQQKVLNNFTGKKKWQVFLNQQYGKWAERQQPSQQTAYLLAYINKDNFEQYQNLQIKIPNWQMERLQQKLTQQQFKTMIPVKLFVFRNEQQFRPFQQPIQILQQMKLSKDKLLEQQLTKLQKQLSCKIGTIWKVNCKTRTIKYIHKDYGERCQITVARHTQFKRGIRQPDYFIIIPQQKMSKIQDYQRQKLGILHIQHITEQSTKDTVEVLLKQDINARLAQFKRLGLNVQYNKQDLQYFVYGWNDYLFVRKS